MGIDYKNGKIYKLVNNSSNDCYYGSTCDELYKRKYQHKKDYQRFLNNKGNYITSYKIFDPNIDDVEIVLVEEFPCDNKQQLHAKERFYIEANDCVNKNIPGRTLQEHKDNNRQLCKNRYNVNKSQILENRKHYYEANKTNIIKRMSTKIQCECGRIICKNAKTNHLRSKVHQKFEASKAIIQ